MIMAHTTPSDSQLQARAEARAFVAEHIAPVAALIDREQSTPAGIIELVRAGGWLGAALPGRWGGRAMDAISYGLVTEEFGAACSSVRTLLTVHNMAAQAIARIADPRQQARW